VIRTYRCSTFYFFIPTDEPTNHLDLESVEWLEAFLRQQNIPMVIVSHDREFLDQVCTKIVDAEAGECREYNGNYSQFLKLKQIRMEAWQASFAAQEKKLQAERVFINKFKVIQPQVVKQKKERLEKFIVSDEYIKKPPFVGKPFRFRFPDAPRLSPEVAEVKTMSHSYSNNISTNRLFDEVDLFVEKGDRIAVLGPNGSGKSTLLRLMIGREKPDAGTAELVGANVVMNYFEQNQADALDLTKTVIETIQGSSNGQSYNELRALLGQFLFKGDAVEKNVVNLSGGEKARLSLCCMMLKPANLLILDEPTNHLGEYFFITHVCVGVWFFIDNNRVSSNIVSVVCYRHSGQGNARRSPATFSWIRHDCDARSILYFQGCYHHCCH
jgi:ATP-binding cassette subfamily F protein 3